MNSVHVVFENANGAESSNPRGVVEILGDPPTWHWICDRRPYVSTIGKPHEYFNLTGFTEGEVRVSCYDWFRLGLPTSGWHPTL